LQEQYLLLSVGQEVVVRAKVKVFPLVRHSQSLLFFNATINCSQQGICQGLDLLPAKAHLFQIIPDLAFED